MLCKQLRECFDCLTFLNSNWLCFNECDVNQQVSPGLQNELRTFSCSASHSQWHQQWARWQIYVDGSRPFWTLSDIKWLHCRLQPIFTLRPPVIRPVDYSGCVHHHQTLRTSSTFIFSGRQVAHKLSSEIWRHKWQITWSMDILTHTYAYIRLLIQHTVIWGWTQFWGNQYQHFQSVEFISAGVELMHLN